MVEVSLTPLIGYGVVPLINTLPVESEDTVKEVPFADAIISPLE